MSAGADRRPPVCVILGAGPGNGAAFARRFARGGYRTALLAREPGRLGALAEQIQGARGYPCDLTQERDVHAAFARIRAELGEIAVLIYNASTRDFADLDHTDPAAFERAWRVNTYGCLLAVRETVGDMRRRGGGCILIVGATASWKGAAGFLGFCSAKAAQRSLAQSIARELDPQGIHVAYLVIDAVVDVPGSRAMLPDKPDDFFAQPDDIAESAFFVAHQPRSAWTFELDLRPFGERW